LKVNGDGGNNDGNNINNGDDSGDNDYGDVVNALFNLSQQKKFSITNKKIVIN
jgi:hypothetical protein